VTKSEEIALNCESVMERLQRSVVSNPPAYGAKIACEILQQPECRELWYKDLTTMSSRIGHMRKALCDHLVENCELIILLMYFLLTIETGAPGSWTHILSQSGMFGFLGLEYDIVIKLRGLLSASSGYDSG